MSLFINKNEELTFKIYIGFGKKDPAKMYVDVERPVLTEIAEGDLNEETVQEHQVWFRQPSFNDANKFVDASVRMTTNEISINPSALRRARMVGLLTRWTFKDDKGKDVKVSGEAINNLHPHLAAIMGAEMDRQLQERHLL